jgi:adenylosuccinate lyase
MCGRTHGQPGLPITFGFKAAGWLDEVQRHRQRLEEVGARIGV